GVYLLALGRYEDALRDFKKSVQAHPFGPRQAQIQLANQLGTLIALGRIAEARTAARDLTGAYARYLELALAVAADRWAQADSIASEYSNAPSSPDWLRVQARMTGATAVAARCAVSAATVALEHAAEGAPPDFARWYDTGRLLLAGAAERNLAPLPSRATRDTTNAGLVTYGLWEAARGDTTP